MTSAVNAPERFAPGFTRDAVERLSGEKGEPGWLREHRLAAWQAYEATPLPTAAQRAWKYTDVSRLALDSFIPYSADTDDAGRLQAPPAGAHAGVLKQHNSIAGDASLS